MEDRTDFNGDNTYEVTVIADDGNGGTDEENITYIVFDKKIETTSYNGARNVSLSVSKNTTAVADVTSANPDNEQLTYSIHPAQFGLSADADKFTINPTTGQLSFISAPD